MYLRHVLNHSEVKRSRPRSEDEQDLKKKEAKCLQHFPFFQTGSLEPGLALNFPLLAKMTLNS